ncbi:MAG: hypothetical protein EOM61_09205 [Bacteroidia bacterium]|nr:hypothetical protein [Bacteroidia bacterium]
MIAIVKYQFSKLDNQHEFAIETNSPWVWYYLGKLMHKESIEMEAGKLQIYTSLGMVKGKPKEFLNEDAEDCAKDVVVYMMNKIKKYERHG